MEIKYHTDLLNKKDGIKITKNFMFNIFSAIEFLNERYDPFGFKLSGWTESMNLNKDDYDDVLGELVDKYKSSGKKMEPEIRLLIMILGSAASFHLSKSLVSTPIIGDVLKNNPDLMTKIQSNITNKVNTTISPPVKVISEKDKLDELYKQMTINRQNINIPKNNDINNLLKKVNNNITTTETNDSFSSMTITEMDQSIHNKLDKKVINKNDIIIKK